MTACYPVVINGENCVTCPAITAVAAVPTQVVYSPRIGWDASAYSAVRRSGPVYTEFQLSACVGTVVGLANARASNDPRSVPHGFYCYQNSGREFWSVAENGVEKTTPVVRVPGTDLFRIERRGELVTYFHNNTRVYVSTLPSIGQVVVVACLYASGDGVG